MVNKKRATIIAIIIFVAIAGMFYYDNSKKTVLLKDITSDSIEKVNISNGATGRYYRNIYDDSQIEGILEYIHVLQIKSTEENAPNETPDVGISLVDKEGNRILISIYGNIVFLYPEDRYPGKYRLYGFDFDDLDEVCEKLGINPVK